MSRCSTPDRLIGIGGGGSRVVYRFMQQEWLLEDVMKTEEYNESVPDTLRATVIDSATDDDFHNLKSAKVEEKVEKAYEGTGFLPEDGFLEFDGPHLISEMVPDRWRGRSLTSPPAVRDLCYDQDLHSWWLKEGREPLSKVNDEGFYGGVLRRRSVSKLLFHIAEYTDNSVVPKGPNEDQIYIVVALGGGTGSGMAIDLASEIQGGNNRVHLFGVLPHENAGGLEKTNAHAALSELEYAQLTGEGPFDTVTLVPHIKALENADRDFEMGVVRSILAHKNSMGSGNFTTYITPTSDTPTNPPLYTPFTFAVPYTVQYDIGIQPEAKQAVREFLEAKDKELQCELRLYKVIDEYLNDCFEDSAGQGGGTLGTEKGREEAYQLRKRIEEDIRGTMLEQKAFELADVGDLVEDLKTNIDKIPNVESPEAADTEEVYAQGEEPDPMDEAVNFIQTVPEKIEARLRNSGKFDYEADDDIYYDLVGVIEDELTNIKKRRDIWKSVSTITAENTNLEQDEAELVRTALREIIMNPEREFLSDIFENPSIEEMVAEWREQQNALEGTVGDLETFHETVKNDLVDRLDDWNESAYEDAKTLAAINEHEEAVANAIEDLISEIENAVERTEGAKTEEAVDDDSLDMVGPLTDMEIRGVTPLNDKLEEMGVEHIPMSTIASGFSFVKDAKRNRLKHNGGILRRNDESDAFETNVTSARNNGWFEINPTSPDPNVEEAFSCRFKSDKLYRDSAIEAKRDDLIESMVGKLEEAFTTDGQFITHSFEYSTNMSGTDTKTISLPQGFDWSDFKRMVQKALRETEATDPEEVLNETLSMNVLDTETPTLSIEEVDEPTTKRLAKSYLQPITSEHTDVEGIVTKLTGGEAADSTGLLDRFELLQGLSTGRVDRADLELYQTQPYKQGGETYGQSFAWNYDGLYQVDLDHDGIDSDETRDHPYLRRKEANVEDMAGSPEHIGEAGILEDEAKERRIVRDLANSVTSLLKNEYGQAPITNLSPTARGEEIKPNYGQIRVCPVYMSRALEDDSNLTVLYEQVKDRFNKEISIVHDDMYNPESHNTGDPDEITMVSFIGGIFLDNIELVTKRGGYKETYERSSTANFIGAHHTIGLAGMWDRWRQMKTWIDSDADHADGPFAGADFGGYVYRETTRNVDNDFMSEIMMSDDDNNADTRDIFLDMLTADAYESTIDISQKATIDD